jgi:hypothetical protein
MPEPKQAKTTDSATPCTPVSITLAVLLPDNSHQISFGMTKGCNPDNSAFWIIDFVFRDKVGDDFQDRVKLQVAVNTADNPAAAALAKAGLSNMDITFLNGPVTNRAAKLAPGTTQDAKTSNMLSMIVDQHASA